MISKELWSKIGEFKTFSIILYFEVFRVSKIPKNESFEEDVLHDLKRKVWARM